MSAGLCSQTDCMSKIFTLEAQWLSPINMGNGYFTKAIRKHGASVNIPPFVVNLEHLCRVGIVVDCHSRVTDHRHAANFAGMKPASMDMCGYAIRKLKIKVSNIDISCAARSQMTLMSLRNR